jgi:hypothetical protein
MNAANIEKKKKSKSAGRWCDKLNENVKRPTANLSETQNSDTCVDV